MKIVRQKNEKTKIGLDLSMENMFINRMLLLEGKLKIEQMKDHIYAVLGAGYETSGNAIAHCVLILALHPEIQEKTYREIINVFPYEDSVIDNSSLSQCDFLDRVFKETLRFAPAVPTLGREALEDFELSSDLSIKKGTIFCVDVMGLHRRKSLWGEDADLFNPDRFLPENFSGKEHFFMPFSVGKRNCLGYKYASVSFKLVLLKLLRNFEYTTSLKLKEIKFTRQLALKLIGPHLVSIQKRNKN